jgi:hypothetical protein
VVTDKAPPSPAPIEALIKMLIAALTAPAASGMPEWARNGWHHPASFQSGMRHESAPSKPVSEMMREEKISFYMASRGRAYRRGQW